MFKGTMGKEIVVKTLNAIGVLAEIARTVADKGIGILAVSAWGDGVTSLVHLVTDDNLRASEALQKKGYEVHESGVVMAEVPHRPGLLKHLTETLAQEGIDTNHLYATGTADQARCLVVLSTSNNGRALVALHREIGAAAR